MGRQNIFTTLSVASVMPMSQRNELLDFLVANRQYLFNRVRVNEAFKTRFSSQTYISDIVSRLVTSGKDQAYSLIRLPSKTAALPEAADMTFVPFDILQLKDATPSHSKALSLVPEINDKIIINITDLTNASGEFNDATQFQWRVVRDFLSRSFFTSPENVWISPVLVRYVAKVYSMTIGGRIARQFNLPPVMQTFVQSVFAAFFICKMSKIELTSAFMKSHARDLDIYDSRNLDQVLAFIEDTLGKKAPESLEEVFKVIDAYGHDQLRTPHGPRITRPVLNMKFQSLHSEGRVSAVALEYPPYFLFLILLALSGVRNGLTIAMKEMRLEQEGKRVIEASLKSPLFISGI